MSTNTTNTSGDTVVDLDFKTKVSGDNISDVLMAEITRRLEGTIPPADATSDIWDKPTPPEDKSLIWWPKDPVTGARVGQPKVWDPDSETWVTIGAGVKPSYGPRKRRNGFVQVAAGNSLSSITFAPMDNADFHVTLTSHLFQGTAYITPPATLTGFSLHVASRASSAISIATYGAPPGGCRIEWEVVSKAEETPL